MENWTYEINIEWFEWLRSITCEISPDNIIYTLWSTSSSVWKVLKFWSDSFMCEHRWSICLEILSAIAEESDLVEILLDTKWVNYSLKKKDKKRVLN